MGKLIIEISLKDNNLYYVDSEKHSGDRISSHVKPGTTINWIVSKGSDIVEINSIGIEGTEGYFASGPSKINDTKWTAQVSDEITEGEIKYKIGYTTKDGVTAESLRTVAAATTGSEEGTVDPPDVKTP